MRRYKFVVLTSATPAREGEYNEWYQHTHLRDIVAIPGFKSAQRFKLTKCLTEEEPFPYLAIYDIETDDINGAIAEMESRSKTGAMFISDAMSTHISATLYEELAPLVSATSP